MREQIISVVLTLTTGILPRNFISVLKSCGVRTQSTVVILVVVVVVLLTFIQRNFQNSFPVFGTSRHQGWSFSFCLKGLGHAILGNFSTDQMVVELTKR